MKTLLTIIMVLLLVGCDTQCDEEELLYWETVEYGGAIVTQPITTCK